ncbi:hypothetical protein HZB88_00165 [archaeon]|nr:hypothetical protein [archaeon]
MKAYKTLTTLIVGFSAFLLIGCSKPKITQKINLQPAYIIKTNKGITAKHIPSEERAVSITNMFGTTFKYIDDLKTPTLVDNILVDGNPSFDCSPEERRRNLYRRFYCRIADSRFGKYWYEKEFEDKKNLTNIDSAINELVAEYTQKHKVFTPTLRLSLPGSDTRMLPMY